MFTTPCFIRKNTPELRKKLEELGYFYTYYHDGNGIYCYDNIAQTFTYNNEIPKECIGVPQDNEDLFLALAALRDDSDINQWFIYNTINNAVSKFETIEWILCKNNNVCNYLNWDNCYKYCHKATVEEIIEHFKKD